MLGNILGKVGHGRFGMGLGASVEDAGTTGSFSLHNASSGTSLRVFGESSIPKSDSGDHH